ncbi:MAG: hypothetical protein AB7T06_27855 [Kofleriaceae bacterium]
MSAAVFLGVPATTIDLDVVHRRTPDNIARLQALLTKIGGFYRHDFANRKLAPTIEALAGRGHQNLMTDHGCRRPSDKSLCAKHGGLVSCDNIRAPWDS